MDLHLLEIEHRSFDEVADALRSQVSAITAEWVAVLRKAMPHLDGLTFEQIRDSVPRILPAIADALASSDPKQIAGVLEHAPKQGLTRLDQDQDVSEVMVEDRLLRALIVIRVEGALGRQLDVAESAALHATIDVMLQQSIVALVNEQRARLRAAAETELKFLSFLAHDLNNNLHAVTMSLKLLRRELGSLSSSGRAVGLIDSANRAIEETTRGMKQLLEHERLRKSSEPPRIEAVNLHELLAAAAQRIEPQLQEKGLASTVEVAPEAVVSTCRDLLAIVLQNLLSNAVKYSAKGVIRIGAEERLVHGTMRWVAWVADEGPGIAPERQDQLFQAFRRGEAHGQEGVGLGLAIAAQAARLLNAELSVQSELGVGSTFSLTLPSAKDLPQV